MRELIRERCSERLISRGRGGKRENITKQILPKCHKYCVPTLRQKLPKGGDGAFIQLFTCRVKLIIIAHGALIRPPVTAGHKGAPFRANDRMHPLHMVYWQRTVPRISSANLASSSSLSSLYSLWICRNSASRKASSTVIPRRLA